MRDNWFAMLEGLCHCGELLRGYERGYFFDVSPFHPRRSRFFCFLFVWLGVWLGFWRFLPRFRDLSSSFAKSNDRRSCHGAHFFFLLHSRASDQALSVIEV